MGGGGGGGGVAGLGDCSPPPPQFWLSRFSEGNPFGIDLQDLFLVDQYQKFSKGAIGANITKFEGRARK